MNYDRKIFVTIFWLILGCALAGCYFAGLVEEFWFSMGTALIVVSLLQVIRHIRYKTDPVYKEQKDTAARDERNRFLANKAWAWSGYLFVMIAAVATIAFKLAGQNDLMILASSGVCLMLLLYWGCYLFLRKKY